MKQEELFLCLQNFSKGSRKIFLFAVFFEAKENFFPSPQKFFEKGRKFSLPTRFFETKKGNPPICEILTRIAHSFHLTNYKILYNVETKGELILTMAKLTEK